MEKELYEDLKRLYREQLGGYTGRYWRFRVYYLLKENYNYDWDDPKNRKEREEMFKDETPWKPDPVVYETYIPDKEIKERILSELKTQNEDLYEKVIILEKYLDMSLDEYKEAGGKYFIGAYCNDIPLIDNWSKENLRSIKFPENVYLMQEYYDYFIKKYPSLLNVIERELEK